MPPHNLNKYRYNLLSIRSHIVFALFVLATLIQIKNDWQHCFNANKRRQVSVVGIVERKG